MPSPAGAEPLAPGLWRLELPSRTLPPFETTNSYLIAASSGALLVDPGSDHREGIAAIEQALHQCGVGRLAAVLLTHTHRDHCAGLDEVLALHPNTRVLVHPLELERIPGRVAAQPLFGVNSFDLAEGSLLVLHTPGHSPGSVSLLFPEQRVALVGDLLAGRGSSWIGRPDGNITDYLASLELLLKHDLALLGPGHGSPLTEAPSRLHGAREHRLAREAQIVTHLGEHPLSLAALRDAVYPGLDTALHDAAQRSLLAHLDKLVSEDRAVLHEERSGTTAAAATPTEG